MKKQRGLVITAALIGALIVAAGCGKKSTGEGVSVTHQDAAGVIPEYQLKALEKAKGVESQLHSANEARQKILEQ
ncbi:MAG: hypothetical protein U5M23_07500 [Marinagarivorans sp.]|nr:hypothetical protein [Marinagarivorans sp.]